MRYAAVIAAAGLSSRVHEFKPMVCLGESTFITGVVSTFREAGVDEIIVVAGYRSELLEKHLEPLGVTMVKNPDYASTRMFDSLCLGIRALSPDTDGVFLTRGDVPLIQAETLRYILASGAPAARPIFREKPGRPVYFSRQLLPAVLSYSGKNGLRGAIEALKTPITDIPVNDIGVVLDTDTPEDLKALRRQELKNRNGGGLWMDLNIRIGRGDTVLTPESMQLLEMVDHTGSIQSACGCLHISYTKGWRLLNDMEKGLGFSLTVRETGGSDGGRTLLTDKGASLAKAYRAFRTEMNEKAQDRFASLFSDLIREV